MRIYLADLGHNLLTRSSDVYPLGIANLATWLLAHRRDGGEAPEVRLFREPQDLKAALDEAPPDLLGLSSYAWNEELAVQFAAYAKRRHARTLTALGGPNYPLVDEVRAQVLRSMPAVDVFVDGPTYEGERAFLNLYERLRQAELDLESALSRPIDGVDFLDRASGAFVRGGLVERIRDLDEIPSPYLAGWMEPYLASEYFPMMQIARGCPFTCSFCNSGVQSNSRVFAHSIAAVQADLVYLAERVKPETTLCFADDNFGMYERDVELADFIGHLQDRYDWPRYIRTTTGKNRTDRILAVLRKTRGALPMTAAVQSLNPQVLKNIKRDNIKLETYAAIQKELEAQGMQSYGELILCLPGETRASIMQAMEKLLDAGAKRISAHQLMLLHGAELANPAERARFGFETRFRVVARNIGDYTGEPVVEVEEMVVATPDFSWQDYLDTRVFHLLLTIFFYEGNFDEAFALAAQHGIKPFHVMEHLAARLEHAPPELRQLICDFLREGREELFESREECLRWAREHYDGLVDGSLGGNLLSKYSMIGRFHATGPALAFLRDGIASLLAERAVAHDPAELACVIGYLDAVLLRAPFSASIASPGHWRSTHDVEAWFAAGRAQPLAAFARPEPLELEATLPPDRRRLIESRLAAFGEHPSALGRFTRTLFARDLRRAFAPEPADRAGELVA